MTKNKKRASDPVPRKIDIEPAEQIEQVVEPFIEIEPAVEEIRPRRFHPDPCPMCLNDRPKGSNYSRVYGRDGKVRYIRCDFCRHRYKQAGP